VGGCVEVEFGSFRAVVIKPQDSSSELVAPLVLLHGLGLGAWSWERTQQTMLENGIPTIAIDVPYEELTDSASVDALVERITEAVRTIQGVSLLGHSAGALLARRVAAHIELAGLVQLMPMPLPRERKTSVGRRPRMLLRHGISLMRGKPIVQSRAELNKMGLDLADETRVNEIFQNIKEIPALALRALFRASEVEHLAVEAPSLVIVGHKDTVTPWRIGRLLGDYLNAIIWRYDDLGHFPMFQTEGVRAEKAIAEFIIEPVRRKVTEAEGWSPNEGVGADGRLAAVGVEGKARSAYGQRVGRQGEDASARWDQNLKGF
jgi:pimeloyl-ACP methyl ester carboxylesterase